MIELTELEFVAIISIASFMSMAFGATAYRVYIVIKNPELLLLESAKA